MAKITVSHAGLCVADLERSVRFWCDGLGFDLAEAYDVGDEVANTLEVEPGVQLRSQMIAKDGMRIELLGWTSPQPHGAPSSSRGQLGLTHCCFTVEDLPAVEARLVEHGGTVIESTRTRIDLGALVINLLFLADPDGTRVELMETVAT